MAGCSHVAHVASPLPAGVPKDAKRADRSGARRRLARAARGQGQRRQALRDDVVGGRHLVWPRPRHPHFTEADWTLLGKPGITPYIQSKTIAERARADWVAKEGGGIEFCAINPSVVLGPVWSPDYSASVSVVKRLLDGGIGGLPRHRLRRGRRAPTSPTCTCAR